MILPWELLDDGVDAPEGDPPARGVDEGTGGRVHVQLGQGGRGGGVAAAAVAVAAAADDDDGDDVDEEEEVNPHRRRLMINCQTFRAKACAQPATRQSLQTCA